MDLISGFQEIISENNHAAIYCKMCEIAPKILDFEWAGLLIKDSIRKNLYSASVEKGQDGELFIWDIISYPSIGITGSFFSEKNPWTTLTMYNP